MSTPVPADVRLRVRFWAGDRCSYCRASQDLIYAPLEIEHIVPVSLGGTDDEENYCLACRSCNNSKRARVQAVDPVSNQVVPLFNPRTDRWEEHFTWSEDGTRIFGLTPCGRATALALQMNNRYSVLARGHWVKSGLHPP